MPRWLKIMLNTVGVLIVLAAALLTARAMMESRASAPERPREARGELVETLEIRAERMAPLIRAQGTVVSGPRMAVSAEVSGRVTERHPALEDGGVIDAGETLFRIDSRDYRIAVEEAETALAMARTQRAIEEGRQRVARREWERFGDAQAPSPLALREPQLRQAELEIERAEQALSRARLQLERTRVRAPMRALIQNATVETGQLVTPGQTLATLVAVDEWRVQAAIPVASLSAIAVPGYNSQTGSPVRVRTSQDGGALRDGVVLRLLGEVDPVGRMARLLVALPDPLGSAAGDGPVPLLLGDWVEVEIAGRDAEEVYRIPRVALRRGEELHVFDADGLLDIRTADIAWREPEHVVLRTGLAPAERLVVSRIAAPVQGMPLRDAADTGIADPTTDATPDRPVDVAPEESTDAAPTDAARADSARADAAADAPADAAPETR